VAEVLETMAQLQRKAGNIAEATKLEQRVEEIRASKQITHGSVAKAIE
jgi:hypothetical protein